MKATLDPLSFVAGFTCSLVFIFVAGVMLFLVLPWFRAFLSGTPLSLFQVLGMRLRGSPIKLLLDAQVALVHSGLQVDMREVESIYLANRGRILDLQDLVDAVREHHAAYQQRLDKTGSIGQNA